MPVGAIAREPGDFGADDQAYFAQADIGDQALEALAARDLPGGPSLVLVDEHDLVPAPAQLKQAATERSLIDGAFTVLQDLLGGGLPQVDDGQALPVGRQDLGRAVHVPRPP